MRFGTSGIAKEDPAVVNRTQNGITAPASSEHAPPPTLLLTYDGWTNRHGRIIVEATNASLYEFDSRMTKPQMTFRRSGAPKGDNLGTVTFHSFSRSIEVQAQGRSFEMNKRSWKSRDLQWTSPAFAGQTMTWQVDHSLSGAHVVLLDGNRLPVAKYSFGGFSMTRTARIEFMGDRTVSQEMLDELVITGAAVMQAIKRQAAAAGGAGG